MPLLESKLLSLYTYTIDLGVVKDNTQVYFFGATKNWCTGSVRALFF